ncbi:DNA-directed RNA polymerase I subunit RPA34.5-domain-containing protein [Lipomyces kononenkoae]
MSSDSASMSDSEPYVPPRNFKPLAHTSNSVSFSDLAKGDKQLWLLKFPKSMGKNLPSKIPLPSPIMDQEAKFEHDGTEFAIVENKEEQVMAGKIKVLCPDGKGNLRQVPASFEKILHINEVANIPKIDPSIATSS